MRKSVTYAVAALALIGCKAANATEIGKLATHGADLRRMCMPNVLGVDTRQVCDLQIDMNINENVAKQGRSNDKWDIPDDAQLEDLEKNVVNYIAGGIHPELEQADAHELVGVVLMCRYPSAEVKAKLAASPAGVKECNTIYGKKGS